MTPSSRFPLRPLVAAFALLAVGLFAAPASVAAEAAAPVQPAPGQPAPGELPNELTDPAADPSYAAEGDDTVHDITFPLPEGAYAELYDSYDDPRSGGRIHRANDIMADKLTPVHAVVDGEIIFAPGTDGEPKPSYGYMIRLAGDDGMFYSYVHLNDDADPAACDRSGGPEVAYAPGIAEGVRVERGQHIGWVGSSGNASCAGPHLHFEIGEDARFEVRHNPMASLEAAEERGDFPGSESPAGPPTGLGGEGGGEGPSAYTRLAGDSRVETAVALSEETRDSARAVVVVPSGSHVEALLAAPLADLVDAPVLLAGPDGLSDAVEDEIRRIAPLSAYVVGTTEQLSTAVEDDLEALGVTRHSRLAVDDRFALSARVAEEVLSYPEVETLERVILAVGAADDPARAWPDALSAAALAAHTRTPILLTRSDHLPDAVADLLAAERPAEVVVVGGTVAVSQAVAEEAAELADADLVRLAGDSRYATSVAVAEAGLEAGLSADDLWIATGRDFPDALAAGPAAARSGSPLLLVDGADEAGAPESRAWLREVAERLVVVGGDAAVRESVAEALIR